MRTKEAVIEKFINYFNQVGIAWDMLWNTFFGGKAGQTLSYRAALGMEAKKPFWCVFCRFLSWLVQRNHCEDQLAGIPMKDENHLRAFGGFVVLSIIFSLPFIWLYHLL